MSDFPEHDKMTAVAEQTQAIGEFLEWLASEGVHLMVWREDLTDTRPTDPECGHQRRRTEDPADCDPDESLSGLPLLAYWRTHCKHWHDPNREADGDAEQGTCCRCHKGRLYEVTGLKSWAGEQRHVTQLLADWAGIDLRKLEAEKRQMLAAIRSANVAPAREG